MQEIILGGLRFGPGIPNICVPLTGRDLPQLLRQAAALPQDACDLAEWRADCYDGGDAPAPEALLPALAALRPALCRPLLFTFRTRPEGGRKSLPAGEYRQLLRAVIASGLADWVDLELFPAEPCLPELIREAHQKGVGVIVSSHDFEKTPPRRELTGRMRRMLELGADLPKVAVTPRAPADVLELLAATAAFTEETGRPVVTMSMGTLGVVSRICGETFGSAMTFGAAEEASAPGQLPAGELAGVLRLLHGAGARPAASPSPRCQGKE